MTETVDVGIIIAKDVPTARCIIYCGSIPREPKIKYKKGTVIKPPPIPNNPATKPTGIAVKAINKII